MSLIEQLRRDEGEKLYAYMDQNGFITIGVGVCIDRRNGCGITHDESDLLLSNRIARTSRALSEEMAWTQALDEVRRNALLNMSYNLGLRGLGEFRHFLDAMKVKEWEQATTFLVQSKWATELHYDPANPLESRPGRLMKQIVTGV